MQGAEIIGWNIVAELLRRCPPYLRRSLGPRDAEGISDFENYPFIIVSACFSHEACKTDIANVYARYVQGERNISSFGQQVELLRYEALREGGAVVGAGGIYRLVGDAPSTVWLGWLGIDPRCQGRGLGQALLQRLVDIAVALPAKELKVYTPADLDEYALCRSLYAKMDFEHRPAEDFSTSIDGSTVKELMLVRTLQPAP